jgi:hypothetical protein
LREYKGKDAVLCAVCRINYHDPAYRMCFDCFVKTDVGKRMYDQYAHPWCGRKFWIRREFWDIEANPVMCCIERCEKDPHGCPYAQANYSRYEYATPG